MAIVEDFLIYPAMVRLAACLCNELKASGLPEPCFCGIIEGTSADLDCGSCEDGCGAAWVRLVTAFPTQDGISPTQIAVCNTQLAFQLEVGVTRCFSPFVDDEGNQQGVAEHLEATRIQIADMAAIRRAIACCFSDAEDGDYNLGTYTPIPFSGGCGGGAWALTVQQEAWRA